MARPVVRSQILALLSCEAVATPQGVRTEPGASQLQTMPERASYWFTGFRVPDPSASIARSGKNKPSISTEFRITDFSACVQGGCSTVVRFGRPKDVQCDPMNRSGPRVRPA